jgi:hypothetical protein
MQQIFYDDAPYHVLYYDNELHAYRTDKFANWTNQPPENGTPLFGFGPFGYTVLKAASEVAASPSAATGSQAPSASGGTTSPAPTEPAADSASSSYGPDRPGRGRAPRGGRGRVRAHPQAPGGTGGRVTPGRAGNRRAGATSRPGPAPA